MTFASTVLATGPIRYYQCEETSGTSAADATGNVVGTWVSGEGTIDLGIAGFVGNGFRLQQSDEEFFQMGFGSGWGLTSAWSLMFAFKEVVGAGGTPVLWRDDTSSNGWLMQLTSSKANLAVRANGGTDRTITGAGTTLTDGSWHLVIMTSSGTVVKTYIDGALVDTWTRTAAASTLDPSPIRFGRNGTNLQYYTSCFDEIASWNMELTAANVTAIWNARPPGNPTNLAITDETTTTLTFSWDPPTTGGPVSGYEVRIDGGPAAGEPISTSSPYVFDSLTPGTTYLCEVVAVGAGDSDWVGISGATLPAGYPVEDFGGNPVTVWGGSSWVQVKVF